MFKIFHRFITRKNRSNRPVLGVRPLSSPPPMPPPINKILKTELDFFDQNRKEWYEHHAGKIVVIHKTIVYGFYDNYENALKAGYDYCGLVPFLLKEVLLEDRIEFIF